MAMDVPVCPRHNRPMILRHAKHGPHPGSAFYGCPEYPRCRYTVDATATNATSDQAVAEHGGTVPNDLAAGSSHSLPEGGMVLGEAGGSAKRQYERRKTRFEARRPTEMRVAALAAVVVGLVAFVVVARLNMGLGALCGLLVAGIVLLRAWLPPMTTQAWSIGAEGEQRTAAYLDPLAAEGYVILHDLRMPRSGANIDHVAIGRTGVFVIDTKNVAGWLRIRGEEIWIGGHRVATVGELRKQAAAVEDALGPRLAGRGLHPTVVLCAHRADLPWLRRSVGGVQLTTGRGLARLLREGTPVLSATEVSDLAARVVSGLPMR
jgi:hypothetical protein